MSYLDYPRVHFSGSFTANPSTINNTPNNYNPLIYPSPEELQKVELYWNPKGDGNFGLMEDCVIRQVDYADGTTATTPEEDSIIGQPVKAVYSLSFPLQSALVDLDPMQQNTSEVWAMVLQIGGDTDNLTGKVSPVAFNDIWQQCQGPNFPHSSASGSAVFQTRMTGVTQTGDARGSKFLQYFKDHPTAYLSLNFNTSAHNNAPQNYRFNDDNFTKMKTAGVPDAVLAKIAPTKTLFQLSDENNKPISPGDLPTKVFVKYMLAQYLTLDEFNSNIDAILRITELPYQGFGAYDFNYGFINGTVGTVTDEAPTYFVPSRVLCPPKGSSTAFYAPFRINEQNIITLNLGNALPTNTPGNDPYQEKLGTLWLVAFPDGHISADNAQHLVEIPYQSPDFLGTQAGFFTYKLEEDCSATPLGILSIGGTGSTTSTIILAENSGGYYLRADQFVYRMNPGIPTTPDFPRGETNTVQIHALKFGNPVPDGTVISLTMKTEAEAEAYTVGTLGTSGTKGVKNLSIPQDALTFPPTATTQNGVATFAMSCKAPGNPRQYVDGQVYFLDYDFVHYSVIKSADDLVSVMVYDQEMAEDATTVLAKFGRLYKVMDFLADEEKVSQIDLRNMVKTLLQKPYNVLVHMPVTRDLSEAARNKIIAWIDALNNS